MADFDKLIVSFLVDEVVGGFFISVPPGHVACIYDRGRGVLSKIWGPGLHLKLPFWQIAKLFNARVLEYTIRQGFDFETNPENLGDKEIRAMTKDQKQVIIEGSILFKIDKKRVNELWENIGDDFVSKIVRPLSRSRIRAVVSEVNLDELINQRTNIENKLQKALWSELDKKGLICEGVLLSDVVVEQPDQELQKSTTQLTDSNKTNSQDNNQSVEKSQPQEVKIN